jgi:hypothetical protein
VTRLPLPGDSNKQKAFKQYRVILSIQLLAAVGLILYGIATDDRAKLYGGVLVLILWLLVGLAVHRAARGLDKKPA